MVSDRYEKLLPLCGLEVIASQGPKLTVIRQGDRYEQYTQFIVILHLKI